MAGCGKQRIKSKCCLVQSFKIPTVHPDLYSVIASDYNDLKNIGFSFTYIPRITFTIHNESGYIQDYFYTFQDEENGWLENSNAYYNDPFSSTEVSFMQISLGKIKYFSIVNPIHHSYRSKSYNFEVLNVQINSRRCEL